MTISIPSIVGVPGISGPPNWLGGAGVNFRLNDVRWNGAVQRASGVGSSTDAAFRATQAIDSGQKIYLSFRAPFVEGLSDNHDFVYIGLMRTGGSKAMVIRIKVHAAGALDSGDTLPPATVAGVEIFTRLNTATSWTPEGAAPPTWIGNNTRAWLKNSTPADPNNHWAIQMRIPVATAGDITAAAGPNIGTDFRMWFLVQGATSTGSPVILGEYRASGVTPEGDLGGAIFPNPFLSPSPWDQFLLTSGPAATGGVALRWGDVRVRNALHGEGTLIDNGADNTFVARPRNYTTTAIPADGINATFRIANWGSVAGDPHRTDFTSGEWTYVPGNSETVPVLSSAIIPTLAAGSNPPTTNNQLTHLVSPMTLDPGKSYHQCIYVTLSGVNLTFLNDSIYQNMDFDGASLLAREASISVMGLAPFSPQPRDVYLAVEKVNMPANTPAGTDQGQFLQNTMNQLIAAGGPLAEKLQNVRAALGESGDFGASARLDALLAGLVEALAGLEYSNRDQGLIALEALSGALRAWLLEVKRVEQRNPAAAKSLAALFEALAEWLEAGGVAGAGKLLAFITRLSAWLSGLANDPVSAERLPEVVRALRAWLATLVGGERFTAAFDVLERWLAAGRPVAQLPAVLNALRELLTGLSGHSGALKPRLASFSRAVAAWLRGAERLQTFVGLLNDAGLTTEEYDQLFPTVRIHAYHDTGERVRGSDGVERPVLRAQSSFGHYLYHEGALDGWQTAIEGAQRIADNLYLLAVPNNGSSKVTVRVQGVEPGEERIPEDPIRPPGTTEPGGCLEMLFKLLGMKRS